jgi:ABC-type multidrug transport system permease subunit
VLFTGLAFLELLIVCFITPAVTAGAVSGEREKQTYEMLLATPLRPASIQWGKLISALSYVALLLFASIPMASLVFIFGGIAPRDMIKTLIILVAVAVTLGVIGIFMSTWLRRTGRATVLSYLIVLALLLGPLLIYILVGVLRQDVPPRWILVPNPVSAVFSVLSPAMPRDGPAGVVWGMGMAMGGNLDVLSGSRQLAQMPRPLYHYTLPLYGGISLALYLLATRLMQPTHPWRVSWKQIAIVLTLFVIYGILVGLGFALTANRYENRDMSTPPVVEREVVLPAQARPTATPTPAPPQAPEAISPLGTPSLALPEEDGTTNNQ